MFNFSSNSADSPSTMRSMTSSEDEDDPAHQQLLLPTSLDLHFSENNDVINPCTIIEINHNDTCSITTDVSQSSSSNSEKDEAFTILSTSSSETSLSKPLLSNKHDNAKDTPSTKSPTSSTLPPSCFSFFKFYLVDMLLSAFIITPLVNIHWRGAWDLLDIYVLPSNEFNSALISLGVGLIILYFIYLIQNYLQEFYEKHRNKILGHIMTRAYTLIIALAYINQWRGLWNLLDLTSNAWQYLVIETLISVLVLLSIKSIYSLNSSPFLIGVDTESYFILGSKRDFQVSSKTSLLMFL